MVRQQVIVPGRTRSDGVSSRLRRDESVILALLLALAAAAWGVLGWQSLTGADGQSMQTSTSLQVLLFLAMWVDMMVAMMFPTAAPMILTFHRLQRERQKIGRPFVSTWIFVAAYLLIWAAFGAVAFAAAGGVGYVVARSGIPMDWVPRLGGLLIAAAGIYQLTPFKGKCLSRCQTPTGFILTSWRDGRWGAFLMGMKHGGFCLGCCWLLFVILFPIGVMNLVAMALITVLIFAEKSFSFGRLVSRAAAVGLVAYGFLVMAMPWLLPAASMQGQPGM